MRADGSTFAHEHAEVEDDRGRPVFAMPGQTFGPELDVHAEFHTPGTYRLWGQFRLADGAVLTVPFTVEASRPLPAPPSPRPPGPHTAGRAARRPWTSP